MDFNYTKIKIGNLLYKYCFPLYNFSYSKFKQKSDKVEIALLKNIIHEGDSVLDIGANIGFYANLLSDFVGEKGKIYCFEPDSENFKHLLINTKRKKNITLFNKAVSDKSDLLKVYKSKLLNVDHRTYPVNNYDTIEEVESVNIDELIRNKIIEKVDIIKIDIQGYELTAFKGMRQLLNEQSDLKIVAEYWPHGFMRAGSSAVELYDFFVEMGYGFFIISEDNIKKIDREFILKNNNKPFEYSFNVLIKKLIIN